MAIMDGHGWPIDQPSDFQEQVANPNAPASAANVLVQNIKDLTCSYGKSTGITSTKGKN
jgi:hypothetical protein